jgi:hypothetical protein
VQLHPNSSIYLPQSIGPLHGSGWDDGAKKVTENRLYVRDDLTLAEIGHHQATQNVSAIGGL